MANVVRNKAVTKTETVEITPEQIVLTMSADEALALKVVVGSITGNPRGPIRTLTAKIYGALNRAGVEELYTEMRKDLVSGAKTKDRAPDTLGW